MFFSSLGHVQVGVHPALRMGSGPSLVSSEAWASKLKAQAISTSKRASVASRAAATRSTRDSVPNSGPMKMAARRSRLALEEAPFGADVFAGPGLKRREADACHPFRAGGRRRCADAPAPSRRNRSAASSSCARRRLPAAASSSSIELLLVGGHDAVRRQAFDRERARRRARASCPRRAGRRGSRPRRSWRSRRRSPSGARCGPPTTLHASGWPVLRVDRCS